MLVDAIPDPACSSPAARADSAAPITVIPHACQAARAASNPNVLPLPAAPTTTSMPAPELTSRVTISSCSVLSAGRAARAAVSAAGHTTPALASIRTEAASSRAVSTARRSAVVNRAPAVVGTVRPSARRIR